MKKSLKTIIFTSLISIPFIAGLSFADISVDKGISNENLNTVACVAVFPCDKDGNLLEQYSDDQSPCFDRYFAQCVTEKLRISQSANKSCQFENATYESKRSEYLALLEENARLKAENSRLKQIISYGRRLLGM